jgi:hypothetical protein
MVFQGVVVPAQLLCMPPAQVSPRSSLAPSTRRRVNLPPSPSSPLL